MMDSQYIQQILGQYNDINKNQEVFKNKENTKQQVQGDNEQTFLQKELSDKEAKTIQDVSLIHKHGQTSKVEESQQDISQFFK